MRKILAFALVAALMGVQPLAANEIDAPSTISKVTVFPSRAMVTRTATVTVPAGKHKVVFNRLPVSLDENSLRVKGKSAAELIIGSVQSKRIASIELVREEEQKLQDKIEKLNDEKRIINAAVQALAVRESLIRKLGNESVGNINEEIVRGELKPQTWQNAWEKVGEGAKNTLQEKIVLDIKLREMSKQINKLNRELSAIRTGSRDVLQVSVGVESSRSAKAELSISYQIDNAVWQPIYDARLNTKTGALELVSHAQVTQRTGEDWTDVALTLSTAQPAQNANMPGLSSWWVDLYEPRPARKRSEGFLGGRSMKNMMAGAPMGDVAMELAAPSAALQKAETKMAAVVSSEFAAEYQIGGASNVPADNAKHKFTIQKYKLDTELSVRTVPKLSHLAYLFAKGIYTGETPLLPGQMSLFRDGAFIGRSYLAKLRPDEEAQISFGVDDKVIVKRKQMAGEKSEHGMINKEKAIENSFVTTVENLHKQAMHVLVFDNIPVARNEDITITLDTKKTTPGFIKDYKKKVGVLVWDSKYKAGEKKDINLTYNVSYPEDKRLTGM